jgi:hypothetical protein
LFIINKIKNDKINIENTKKEDDNLPFLNSNIKNNYQLKFEIFQNEEQFFNYVFEEIKKYHIKNVLYMIKLFLEKFRNYRLKKMTK